MKIILVLFLIHTCSGQVGFGRSYLRNSRLCHQWSCINSKLNFPDGLPPIDQFNTTLRGLLPPTWHGVVDTVVHTCYNARPRRYTNTCPSQALLHCAVDQLINNCPEHSLRKDDACAPVNSLAGGLNYMFSQSRYERMESNIPYEKRPAWFLKNYFDSKCCELPPIISPAVLSECGFNSLMMYIKHDPQFETSQDKLNKKRENLKHPSNSGESLRVVSLDEIKSTSPRLPFAEPQSTDPLDCIGISQLIDPEWRHECGFELRWRGENRLAINDGATTTTPPPVTTVTHRDLMVVPQSCEKTSCVFDHLNITFAGTVDVEAFKRVLGSLTSARPHWAKATARVVTSCLTRPLKDYDASCQINSVLACTYDVLSENCPISEVALKHDSCKHSKGDRICQISSSKTRPKKRRSPCVVPELVDALSLTQCGLTSLHKVETVVQTVTKPKKTFAWQQKCQSLSPATSCLLNKMGVMNKYGFIDYFKMREKLRSFANSTQWSPLEKTYMGAFANGPLYTEHCNSAKKLLNVLESMLMTCPAELRVNTPQCTSLLQTIMNTPSKTHNDQVMKHFHHMFYPHLPQKATINRPQLTKVIKTPIYDFGILSSAYVPPVKIIDVNPKADKTVLVKPVVEKKPVVILPVYMRNPHSNLAFRPIYQDGVLRSPFDAHKEIYQTLSKTVTKPFFSPIFTSPSTLGISQIPTSPPRNHTYGGIF